VASSVERVSCDLGLVTVAGPIINLYYNQIHIGVISIQLSAPIAAVVHVDYMSKAAFTAHELNWTKVYL